MPRPAKPAEGVIRGRKPGRHLVGGKVNRDGDRVWVPLKVGGRQGLM
jgi:hypothetical protein